MTNTDIIKFLTSKTINAGFIDRLKIKYRPIICPFQELIGFASEKESVFDVGCGSGQFCALIAEFTNVRKIMGIEINERLVNNANEVNKNEAANRVIKFRAFDGVNIPDEINEYEIIYMIDVFHHIPLAGQQAFMEQLYRKMKIGAKLIFKDIDGGTPMVMFNKMHDLVFAGEIGKEISYGKARTMLEKIGFKIANHYKKTVFVYAHYFVICEK